MAGLKTASINGHQGEYRLATQGRESQSFALRQPAQIQGYGYDTDGFIENTGSGTGTFAYTWDVDGRMVSMTPYGGNTVSVTYDALGRQVEANPSGGWEQFVYDPLGDKLALMSGQTLFRARVPLVAGAVVNYASGAFNTYWHTDWLGSVRFASTASRGMFYDAGIAPYGEHYGATGSTTGVFGEMITDTLLGLSDTPNREYDNSASGRWLSPDPAGLAAVDLTNPQSLNRYAYVMNNPTTLIDPSGLCSPAQPDCHQPCQIGSCREPGVFPPPAGGSPGGISCVVDGLSVGCGSAFQLLNAGSGGTTVSYSGGFLNFQVPYPAQSSQANLFFLDPYSGELVPMGGTAGTIFPGGFDVVSIGLDLSGPLGQVSGAVGQFARSVPWAGSINIPIPPPLSPGGVAITPAYIPGSGTACAGGGVWVGTPSERGVGGGPLLFGNLSNAKNVLSGWSWSFNLQLTPLIGGQVIWNSSGVLAGPTVALVPGAGLARTWSACGGG